jgi:hypothetical protein
MILASFYYEYPTDYTLPVAGVLAAAFLVCIIRLGRIAAGMGVGFLAGLFLAVWVFSRGKGAGRSSGGHRPMAAQSHPA